MLTLIDNYVNQILFLTLTSDYLVCINKFTRSRDIYGQARQGKKDNEIPISYIKINIHVDPCTVSIC